MNANSTTATAPVCASQGQQSTPSTQTDSRSFNLKEEWALIASLYPDECDDLHLNFRTVHAYDKRAFTGTIASYNMYVRIGDLKKPKGIKKVLDWVERNLGKHYNCFFARNPVINKKRNSASRTWEVAVITSFAIDLDGVEPGMALKLVREAGYPDPTMIVRSGIRGAHVYWFLAVPLANTKEAQDRLSAFVLESKHRISKSDHRVRDTIRILRALGGRNLKCMADKDSTLPSHDTHGNRIIHWTGAKYAVTDLLDVTPDEIAPLEGQYQAVISSIQERQAQQAGVLQWVKKGVGPFSWKSENAIPSAVKTLHGAVQYMNDRDMEQRLAATDEHDERWIEESYSLPPIPCSLIGLAEQPNAPTSLPSRLTGLAEQEECMDSSREIDIGFIDKIVPRLTAKHTRHNTQPEVVRAILRSYPEHDRTPRLLRVFHHRFFVLNNPFIECSREESFADFMNCWNLADPSKVDGGFVIKVLANMVKYELAHEIFPGKRYAKYRLLADFLYTACRLKGFKPRKTWLSYKTMAEILGYKQKRDALKAMKVLREAKRGKEMLELVVLVQKGSARGGRAMGSLWAIPETMRNPRDRRTKRAAA